MSTQHWISTVFYIGSLAVWAQDNGMDSGRRHVWAENAGWLDAAPTDGGVTIHFDGSQGYLSGLAWGENIGWVKMGSDSGGPYGNTGVADWGVNLASSGGLNGFAWGENVGWIAFSPAYGGVTIDLATGVWSGHAWGENIGWLQFGSASPDYGVRSLAFDTQAHGTPNWWLNHYATTEDFDAGDGVPAWQKYVMDTNPNVAGDYLRITALTNTPSRRTVVFAPTSSRRHYTLQYREDLIGSVWSNVPGQVDLPGSGTVQALQDVSFRQQKFYRVEVKAEP